MLLRPDGETPDFSDLSDISDVEEEGEESAKRDWSTQAMEIYSHLSPW